MACNCNNRNTRAWTDSNGCLRLNLNGRNFTYCPEGVSVACDPNGEGILINGQLCPFPEPGEANIVTDLEFDSDTNILTLRQENGPPVTVNLDDLADDNYVESATFDSSTSELVLNRTGDLPQIRVTIPTFELPDGDETQVVSYNSDGEPIARSDIDVGYLRYTGSGTRNVASVDASDVLPLGQYNFNSGHGSEVRRGHYNIVLGRYAMAGDPDVDPVMGGPSGQVIIGSASTPNGRTRGDSQHGIAIGTQAEVYGGQWGIAIGSNPTSAAQSAIAIGRVAEATAANSVAIGWQSENDVTDTVSFGNDTIKRRIRNIAAGIDPTDVVNVSQLENLFQEFSIIGNHQIGSRAYNLSVEGLATDPSGIYGFQWTNDSSVIYAVTMTTNATENFTLIGNGECQVRYRFSVNGGTFSINARPESRSGADVAFTTTSSDRETYIQQTFVNPGDTITWECTIEVNVDEAFEEGSELLVTQRVNMTANPGTLITLDPIE